MYDLTCSEPKCDMCLIDNTSSLKKDQYTFKYYITSKKEWLQHMFNEEMLGDIKATKRQFIGKDILKKENLQYFQEYCQKDAIVGWYVCDKCQSRVYISKDLKRMTMIMNYIINVMMVIIVMF